MEYQPCPAPWFQKFSEQKAAAEVLGCPVPDVDKYPLEWKARALAYSRVMEKVKPFLEDRAEQKARTKANERRIMKQVLGKRE